MEEKAVRGERGESPRCQVTSRAFIAHICTPSLASVS